MITLDQGLESLNAGHLKRHARCWKITRTDGTIFRFTNHDHKLDIAEAGVGEPLFTYSPAGGFNASAAQKQEGFETQNLEVVGMLSNSAITNDDLRAGRYEGATVQELIVDWRFPFAGPFLTSTYFVTETKFSNEQWEARVEGLTRKLLPQIGNVYGRNCRYELGDAECKVVLTDFDDTGTVNTVSIIRRKFNAAMVITPTTGIFDLGPVTWTGGNNNGLIGEIKTQDNISGNNTDIEFQLDMPFDIQAGDTFSIIQGCDKTHETCKNKFNNIPNHGGFEFIPGTNRMLLTLKVK
ncbi:MAG: DUF2163 domain-containing protein [Planctomycetes bacterium]|nr:DUF2163 domain-containing protein [Planctomycetota bacterium]